jgi:hypothetical protein
VEREDVLHELEDRERVFIRGAKYAKEKAAFEARLKLKYRQATFYTWMPLEPDPPPPVP